MKYLTGIPHGLTPFIPENQIPIGWINLDYPGQSHPDTKNVLIVCGTIKKTFYDPPDDHLLYGKAIVLSVSVHTIIDGNWTCSQNFPLEIDASIMWKYFKPCTGLIAC